MATLIINGVQVEGSVVITTGAAPPAPQPVPPVVPPVVPPPVVPPPAPLPGVVVSPAEMTGAQWAVGTGQTFKFSAGANTIHAHPLLYTDANTPGNVAGISMNQLTSNTNPRDAWISTVPGALEVSSPYCRKMRNGLGASFDLSFVNSGAGYCNLQKGTTYYLNIKASDPNTSIDYLVSL